MCVCVCFLYIKNIKYIINHLAAGIPKASPINRFGFLVSQKKFDEMPMFDGSVSPFFLAKIPIEGTPLVIYSNTQLCND